VQRRRSKLVSFPLVAVKAMTEHESADVALYVPSTAGGEPVLYRSKGAGLARPDFAALKDSGVEALLVEADVLAGLERAFEARLEKVLQDADINPAEKAEFVRYVGINLVTTITKDGPSKRTLNRASHFVTTSIDGLLAAPLIGTHLLNMAAHHRSTASHMFSVSMLSTILGRAVIGDDSARLQDLGMAGLLHDLGKLHITRGILDKPNALDQTERESIRQHPIESVRLIDCYSEASPRVCQIILQHHERLDGSGYPLGLSDSDLPVESKILAVVDCFHALISRRSYHAPMSAREAVAKMSTGTGTQFDTRVMAAWIDVLASHTNESFAEYIGNQDSAEDGPSGERARPNLRKTDSHRPRQPRHLIQQVHQVSCVYAQRLSKVAHAPQEFRAVVRNISGGGLCMQAEHAVFCGEIIDVLIGPDEKKDWVRARVAWCRKDKKSEHYRIGVQFLQRLRMHRLACEGHCRVSRSRHAHPSAP
jgi:HD-GYP domain-containing protein (c-di-GMP phosphodiesterase class II)